MIYTAKENSKKDYQDSTVSAIRLAIKPVLTNNMLGWPVIHTLQ